MIDIVKAVSRPGFECDSWLWDGEGTSSGRLYRLPSVGSTLAGLLVAGGQLPAVLTPCWLRSSGYCCSRLLNKHCWKISVQAFNNRGEDGEVRGRNVLFPYHAFPTWD